jgi:hypothetical protein
MNHAAIDPPSDEAQRRGRRTLLIIAGLFLLPLLASFLLYYGNLWRPAGSSNKGVLITPAQPLPSTRLRLADGKAANSDEIFRDKWTLVYVGDGRCDEQCRAALVFGRQVRLSLANEMMRVQRVMLATGECCDNQYFASEHAGLVALDASAGESAALLASFVRGNASGDARTLYLVDPLGNLMMRHDSRGKPRDLLTDLKKLLKLSHIG